MRSVKWEEITESMKGVDSVERQEWGVCGEWGGSEECGACVMCVLRVNSLESVESVERVKRVDSDCGYMVGPDQLIMD